MSFNARDLSISLSAVSNPNHVLNRGPKGATFPGWFLTVQENEGYDTILGPVQLDLNSVLEIAGKIDNVSVDWKVEHGMPTARWLVENKVKSCDRAMKEELRRQLDAAEKAAARIPQLKRLLGEDENAS